MAGEQNNGVVILNVYELPMDTSGVEDVRPAYASITSFFSKLLPSAGFGAYHTSLDVDGFCYSFAVGGVSKIPVANKHKYIPSHASFKESIVLGTVVTTTTTDNNNNNKNNNKISSTVQKCLDNLKKNFFTSTGYHLACRNCNHFTETFATALIVPMEDLLKKNPPVLKSYPTWCNRLARTGATILDKSADKAATKGSSNNEDDNSNNKPSYCDVIKEARAAVGIIDYDNDKKMAALSASMSDNNKRRKQKKELTEKQKQILAKLKK
jgi:hypothetical protein